MWQFNFASFFDIFRPTKCGKVSASGITKCDRLLLQSASGTTKCDRLYYKVRQVLQSVTVITKWDVTESQEQHKKQINIDGKQILKNREVLNRLEVNGENNSLLTRKDYKEKFSSNPTVRLINPAKNKLGCISKTILDTTNKSIREAMGLNQWRNTDTVIDLFKGIRNKHLCKFVIFDIKEFYPSITENLL